jgi:hypothetical protein
VIPPDVSWSGSINFKSKKPDGMKDPGILTDWVREQSAKYGLKSTEIKPWHLVLEYDQFDGDGDNTHSGVIDELWVGPNIYRLSYKGDSINQTDYATDKGLFRHGDQRWPNRDERKILSVIDDSFYYAATLEGFKPKAIQRTFGKNILNCILLQPPKETFASPTQYCFDPGGSALRYTRGEGWDQIAYNNLIEFQHRMIAQEVIVTNGGKPYLNIRVKTIELAKNLSAADFTPPTDAVAVNAQRISGVSPVLVRSSSPGWPSSMRHDTFSVTVALIIGKDGHILEAHAISGPSAAYKAAENCAREWVFRPYLVLGQAVEVEAKIELRNN